MDPDQQGQQPAGGQRKRWEKNEPVIVPKLDLTQTPQSQQRTKKHDPRAELARIQERNRAKKLAEEMARTSLEVRQKEKEEGFTVYLRGANKESTKSTPNVLAAGKAAVPGGNSNGAGSGVPSGQPRKKWGAPQPASLSARGGAKSRYADNTDSPQQGVDNSDMGSHMGSILDDISDPAVDSATGDDDFTMGMGEGGDDDDDDDGVIDPEEDELYTDVLGLSSQDLSHLRTSLHAIEDEITESIGGDDEGETSTAGVGGILPHLRGGGDRQAAPATPPGKDEPISVGILPHLSKPIVSRPASSRAQRPAMPSPKEDDLATSQAVIRAVEAENLATARSSLSTAPARGTRDSALGDDGSDDDEQVPPRAATRGGEGSLVGKTLRFPPPSSRGSEDLERSAFGHQHPRGPVQAFPLVPSDDEDTDGQEGEESVQSGEPSRADIKRQVSDIGVNTSLSVVKPEECESPNLKHNGTTAATHLKPAAGDPRASTEVLKDIASRVQRLDRNKRAYLIKMLDRIEAAEAAGIDLRLSMSSADFSPMAGKKRSPLGHQRMSQELTLRLISTWGSMEYIGLTEIEVFAGTHNKITIIPENVDVLGDLGYANVDPEEIGHLVNGRTHTIQASNMWSSALPPPGDYLEVVLLVPTSQPLTSIKIWNYNLMKNLDFGVRELQIYIDDRPVWQGELNRGCGNQIFDYATTITLNAHVPHGYGVDGKGTTTTTTTTTTTAAPGAAVPSATTGDVVESQAQASTGAPHKQPGDNDDDDDEDEEEDVPIKPFGKLKLQDSFKLKAAQKARTPASSAKKQARFQDPTTPPSEGRHARFAPGTPPSMERSRRVGTPDLSQNNSRVSMRTVTPGSSYGDSIAVTDGNVQGPSNDDSDEESDVPIKPFGRVGLTDSVNLAEHRRHQQEAAGGGGGGGDDEVEEDIEASNDIHNLENDDEDDDGDDADGTHIPASMESFSFARFNVMDSINLGSARRQVPDVEKSYNSLAQFDLNNLGRLTQEIGDISVPDSVGEETGASYTYTYADDEDTQPSHSISSSGATDFNIRQSFDASGPVPSQENLLAKFENVVIGENVQGRTLEFLIYSTWGDRNYVGLTALELYTSDGELLDMSLPGITIDAIPRDVTSLPGHEEDPRILENLFDQVSLTCDELHSWLAPFTPGRVCKIRVAFPDLTALSMIRVWNYNTNNRAHCQRGVRHLEIKCDDTLVFRGEVSQANGSLADALKLAECIVFTKDEQVMKKLGEYDEQYTLTPWPVDDITGGRNHEERPVSRGPRVDDGQGPDSQAAVMIQEDVDDVDTASASPLYLDAQVIHLELLDTWGDGYYMGLTGLEVRDELGRPIPLRLSMLDAHPRDINDLEGFGGGDYRTLDKLIDGVNLTTDDRHMWLIPFTPGCEHRLRIDLGRPRRVGSLCFWNYNKSDEDTNRGVKRVMIVVDNQIISPSGGFIIRKAPGNALFDHGFTIPICEPGKLVYGEDQVTSRRLDHNHSLAQEYETVCNPAGSVLKFNFFTTHGDSHYVGLDAIEVFDLHGKKINVDGAHITADPYSVSRMPKMKGDIRVPANLVDGIPQDATGSHAWLAPLVRRPLLNSLYIWFDCVLSISVIRLYNYSRTPARGVCEFDASLDGMLIYRGQLPISQPNATDCPNHISLVFSDRPDIIEREKVAATYRVRVQDVTLFNEGKLLYERSDMAGDFATGKRPTTSVKGQGRGGLQGQALN